MSLFNKKKKTSVLIVTGSCCMPQMAPVEDQVRQIVEKVVSEEDVDAVVRVLPVTQALFGGIPRATMAPALDKFNRTGEIGLPAVLVDGTLVATGIPDPGQLRAALRRASDGEVMHNVQ